MPHPLREAHCHLHAHGQSKAMASLAGCTSLAECLDRLGAAARSLDASRSDPTRWLLARSARPEAWPEHRWPTRVELDRACPDRPLAAWCFDHHALVANSRALAIAGIDRSTPHPEGGVIERDASGEPTGLLLESAARLVWSRVPEPTDAERREHVRIALADLASMGFAQAHDMLSHPWLPGVLADLRQRGELACSVRLYPLVEDLAAMAAARAGWESEEVVLAGGKVFTDGTINSRTAWMLAPYADPIGSHPCGTPLMTAEQIADAIALCRSLGVHLAAHAIGDGAVRACLDAAELAGERSTSSLALSSPSPASPGRLVSALRIEHAELIDPEDVPRFARLGVGASVQPCHLLADIEALQRLLPDRLDRVLPLRSLIDAGCRPGELLWFGSDTPIVRPDPEDSIRAAVHRRRTDMSPAKAIAPEQGIGEDEAAAAFACVS